MTLLQYLNSEYSRTRWPYFSERKLLNQFGNDSLEEINNLHEQEITKRVEGANNKLVKLLVTEDGEIITT